MFKSIFNFIKSFFSSAEDLTAAVDNCVQFAILQTESWVDEALAENQKKAEQLGIDPEYKKEKLKAIRKSQNH